MKSIRLLPIIIFICLLLINSGCISQEERMQQLFDSAKQGIENSNYAIVLSAYSKLKDKYQNEQLSTDLYNLVTHKIENEIEPLISEKKYEEAVSILQKMASDFDPISVYCYGRVNELIKLKDSNVAYKNGNDFYNEEKYIVAFYEYKKVLAESEHYKDAQDKIKELSDKLYPQYLSEAKKLYSKKDYSEAVVKINIAVELKPEDEKAKELQLFYKKAELEFKEKEQAKAEAARIKSKMSTYEFGIGNIGIACSVKVSRTFDGGYTNYTAAKDHIFLWVAVAAYNNGKSTEHINPNDFTLSTPNGYTVNPDTETTYSLNNYFDAIDLPPKGKTQGWLIFHVPKLSKYLLNYNGFSSSVIKEITTE